MSSSAADAIRTLPKVPQTVFVVDDEPAHLRVCERVLQRAGYRVVTAANGASALRALAFSTVDLILLDVFMPERDGFETILTLRKSHAKIPIVVMSGGGRVTAAADVLTQCQNLGASATLTKPFTDAELLGVIAGALGNRPAPG